MRHRAAWCAASVLVAVSAVSCSSPSAPSPGPASGPPVSSAAPPEPPVIHCPDAISLTATAATGVTVAYPTPEPHFGQPPVNVTCAPESGRTFPVGATTVTCRATDAINRTSECTFTVTVAEAPRLRRVRFLAFGDSITEGQVIIPGTQDVELRTIPNEAYPAVLRQLLRARYSTQPVEVFNAGLGGEKAINALSRFPFEARTSNAEAVIILEGYNDLLNGNPPQSIQNVELGVAMVAADARHRGLRVFICTLTPTRPGRRQIPLGVIQAANDRLRAVARGEGAYLIDTFTPLLADVNHTIGSDGLHPTELGYRRIAETVFAAIRADLEQPPISHGSGAEVR